MQASNENVTRVALIGCGQIADAHLQEIRKITGARVVAVCDRNADLAQQAAARFEVPHTFDRLDAMLAEAKPDVLHIATPPRSHLPIALEALATGVNVYVEKPFTIDAAEARRLFAAADAAGKLVCAGHDQLFDPIWAEARDSVKQGQIGQVVHVDSLMGYNLGGPFGKVLSSEPDHWVHSLPGGLFQNNISHAVYRVTEYLADSQPFVWADWYGSIGSSGQPSELRVTLRGENTTAFVLFSSAMRPLFRVARIYGTRGSMEVDLDGRVIRRYRADRLPGAFAKLEVPFRQLTEAARSLTRNAGHFLRSDLQYFGGMRRLFSAFYKAIREGGPPPVPYSDVLRVTEIMDEIFACCRSRPVLPRTGSVTGANRDLAPSLS